ncbi:hypothetical protein AGMMS49525_13120 [Bacteroidia bacterium]|nr:hypothetical protein AGMMS49525_13120 [Bacteroidia bacterium]
MKTNYLDLTLREFLDTITDTFNRLSDIEMYNYLDIITKGFDINRVKIIINDIEFYCFTTYFFDKIDKESIEIYEKSGFYSPLDFIDNVCTGRIDDFSNGNSMSRVGHSIYKVINMLKHKLLPTAENTQATGTAKPQPLQNIIPDLILGFAN